MGRPLVAGEVEHFEDGERRRQGQHDSAAPGREEVVSHDRRGLDNDYPMVFRSVEWEFNGGN